MGVNEYMLRAVELAKRGEGRVSPNPLVGAVIVKDGRVIGEGWHRKYGGLHAERHALENCIESARGADLYVTLEPCCHHGKQPPCTEAIVAAGIKRVYIGSDDPNPLVAGGGIRYLRTRGIEVYTEVEKELCDSLNGIFFHYIRTKTPYVMMKYAMTMDGKIATVSGASKWITGEEARGEVQRDRNRFAGIMAGIQTILADDPMLTCRLEGGRNPVRIICDSRLRIPENSNIVQTAKDIPTIVAACRDDSAKKTRLEALGCTVLLVPEKDGHIDLGALMKILGERGIDSILLEGGGTLNFSALSSGIVQKVQTYIAPKIFGGSSAKSPVEGAGVERPDQAYLLENSIVRRIGEDILIESEVKKECLPV